MVYMVIERYTAGAQPVYERFAAQGRMLPSGLRYLDSWIIDEGNVERCFQLVESDDPSLLTRWTQLWSDLVDFEVHPVISSDEAAARVAVGDPPRPTLQRLRPRRPPANHDLAMSSLAEALGPAYRRFTSGDFDDLLTLLDPNAVYHLPGLHLGGGELVGKKDVVIRLMRARTFCDSVEVEVDDIVGRGPFAVSLEQFRATRARDEINQRVSVIWRASGDGRIAEIWSHMEDQGACDAFWRSFAP